MTPDDRLWVALTTAGGRLRVLSAVNPALWLSGLVIASYSVLAGIGLAPVWPLAVALLMIVSAACYLLVLFAHRDPDRLQSEDFQLKKQSLTMVLEKGTRQQRADAAARVLSATDHLDDAGND